MRFGSSIIRLKARVYDSDQAWDTRDRESEEVCQKLRVVMHGAEVLNPDNIFRNQFVITVPYPTLLEDTPSRLAVLVSNSEECPDIRS